ncbi:MAG TPA: Crp/Fnr family transcriptional regulator [Devosia sp.]
MLASLYARLGWRDTLTDEERRALLGIAEATKVYPAGTDVVREGDRVTRSTLVVDGFATRYRMMQDGERQITNIHIAGDFVDLHSFLLKVMDHSVGALSDCTMVTFAHDDLREVTSQYPHLTRLLWLSTLLDSAINREWIVSLGRLSALQRLAHLVCELYVRLQVVGRARDNSLTVPITQVELGDTLGISSVHVNRVLQEMRERNLVTWKGPRIDILDWDALAAAAEFDVRYLHLEREPR